MRRVFLVLLVLMVVLPAAFLLVMRYSVVADEGYPTWEAVRNRLVRDGEIVVTMPDGVKIISARCDDGDALVLIDGRTVVTKIGHSWCLISIDVESDGSARTARFNPQKLNNWNRIRFVPVDLADPGSAYKKFENGVSKGHRDVSWE